MMLRFFLILICQVSWAAPAAVVKDLRPDWLKYTAGEYKLVGVLSPADLSTIYFQLNAPSFKGFGRGGAQG